MGEKWFVKTKKPGRADCLFHFTHKKPRLRVVFKWLALKDSASGRFVDSKRLQPGLAVFALRTAVPFIVRKQKHRSAFLVLTQATKVACSGRADNKKSLLPIKKPRLRVVFKWLALKDSNLQPTG